MGGGNDTVTAALRTLPAVHELAGRLAAPHAIAVRAARRAIEERRTALAAGAPADGQRASADGLGAPADGQRASADGLGASADGRLLARAREIVAELQAPSLRRAINATGVVVHTNLGRAPLSSPARAAVARAAHGYSNLELDLESGERGSRHVHVESLLCELTGAQAAMVVNNGAAAVLLAACALAGPGRAIVVSRGQLVEIGGGFRIPDVVTQSGARLIEVGTTNRTRLADYERALASAVEPVGAILRVHPSNFRSVGYTEEVGVEALCRLGVPVIDDVGSGVLADSRALPALSDEPALARSVAAGAALVCCSGDKLLGGPQAGLMAGTSEAVAAARRHPLARAVRIDKLSLAALEGTLRLYGDPAAALAEIPVLAMLAAGEGTLTERAQRLVEGIGPGARAVRATGRVGGGALPLLELEGPAVALGGEGSDPVALAARLRRGHPPVIARVHEDRLLLDPRTVDDEELDLLIAAARAALEQ